MSLVRLADMRDLTQKRVRGLLLAVTLPVGGFLILLARPAAEVPPGASVGA